MTIALEPKDKLDTAPDQGAVNGPEGELFDWSRVDWDAAEGNVRRLRQRIFTASQAGDLAKVRNLQKPNLRSRSNTLVSGGGSRRSTVAVRPPGSTGRPRC
jgi:RNA-directed DNA polymerase